jgi:hypothetical protein
VPFTSITLTGTYKDTQGNPASGSVILQLSQQMHQPGVGVAPTASIVLPLSAGGFSTAVLATDDAGTQPPMSSYNVIEEITGAPVNLYSIQIPHATSPIDIASCPRVAA